MANKKRLIVLLAVLMIVLVATGCGGKDNTIAEVNGVKISEQKLERQLDSYVQSMTNQGYGEFLEGEEGKEMVDMIRDDMLEEMITHQLLAQEAERLGITPDSEQVDQELDAVKAQLSEEQFADLLADYNWTEADMRNFFVEQLTEQQVYEEVTKTVTVSEEEVQEFYQQQKEELTVVRSSHILVGSEEEARDMLAELEAGADFAQLAQENSICPSAVEGGDLDFFSKGSMVPEYEQVAFELAVGEIYEEPVESDFGYHIIKVTDKKDSLEKLRGEVEDILTMEEKAIMFDGYLQDLKESATIIRH